MARLGKALALALASAEGVGRPLADGAPKHEQPDEMTALPVLWGDEGPAVHPLEASPPAFAQVGQRAR